MASGSSRIFKGAYVGTGSGFSVDAPGFKPRFVLLINVTDPALAIHIEGMADDSAWTQEADQTAYTTSGCITLDDAGFNVGTDAQLNTADDTIHYICGD